MDEVTHEFDHLDVPPHIGEHTGHLDITVSGGWWTHRHSHSHPPDDRHINHTKRIDHSHEHCWTPQERHHHDPAGDVRPAAADHDSALD